MIRNPFRAPSPEELIARELDQARFSTAVAALLVRPPAQLERRAGRDRQAGQHGRPRGHLPFG